MNKEQVKTKILKLCKKHELLPPLHWTKAEVEKIAREINHKERLEDWEEDIKIIRRNFYYFEDQL